MRARSCVIACCAVVLLGIVTAGTAAASPLDKRTTFTFSVPFSVPGVTLPAGSYVFRLANELQGRDVVQVLGADGTAYAMFFTLRTLPGEPVDKPEIQFMESAAGMPLAVKGWWYPADTQGYEFVYPRGRARLLANITGEPVLAEPAAEETAFEWVAPEPAIEPVAPIAETPALVGDIAAVEETPAVVEEAPQVEAAPVSLPKTASPTATLLLIGALAALAVTGIRRARTVRT